MQQPHEILGISPDADDAEARKAFLRQARIVHPDVSDMDPAVAHGLFQRLNAAYTAFRNPEQPSEWNRQPAPEIKFASETFKSYHVRMKTARDYGKISKRPRRRKKTIGISMFGLGR